MATKIRGITIDLGVDTSKLTKGLKDANSSLKTTQTELKDVNKLLKLDPSNTTLLKQKTEILNTAIGDTKKKLEEQEKLMEEMKKAGNTTDNQRQQQALAREIEATKKQLQDLEKEAKNTPSAFSASMDEFGTKMEGFGGKMENFGNKMMGITASIAGVALGAVSAFNEVDKAYDTVIAKTGASGKELEGMQEIVDSIAGKIPADFGDIGDAVGEVSTRFGLTGDNLEEVATAFLEFAKLNNTDVTSSIDTVQNALSAFAMDSSEAETLLDVLNRTAQNTGADVGSMTSALTSNATALQEMGMDIYQATDFLGRLETAGADAESVISGMKRALKNATDQGKPFKDALADLENEITNGKNGMDGLSSAYEIFGKSGAGIYQAVKNGQISFKKLASTEDVLADSTESVGKTFEATLDPTDDAKIAMNQLKTVGGKLGGQILKDLTPAIKGISEWVGKLSKKWDSLTDAEKKNIMKIAGIVGAIGPVIIAIGKLSTGIGTLIKLGSKVPGILTAIGGNPVLLALGVVAGAIATIVIESEKLKSKSIEVVREMSKLGPEFDELTNKIETRKKDLEEMATASDEARKAVDNEAGSYKELAKKYDDLLTPQGNVKEGYEEEAKAIKETLAKAYEIEEGNVDDLIKKYGSLESAIDHLNTKRKAESYLEIYSDDYADAKIGLNEAYDTYQEGKKTFDKAKSRYDKAVQAVVDSGQAGYSEISEFIRKLSELDGGIAGDEAASKVNEFAKIFGGDMNSIEGQEKYRKSIALARELYSSLVDYKNTVDPLVKAEQEWTNLQNTIKAYDELRRASITGDEQAINDASIKIANHFQYAENSSKESLGRQVTDAEAKLEEYKRLVNEKGSGITQDMVNEQARMVELAKAEASKFTEVGKTAVDSTKKGIDDNKSELYKSGEEVGKSYGDGLIGGMTAKQREVYNKARELGMNVRTAQMEALDINSPSKVAEWIGEMYGQGLVKGLDSEYNPVLDASKKLAGATTASMATPTTNNTVNNSPTIVVNASAGQSASAIADAVINRLNNTYRQTTKTFA